jgi:hypothetical protein
VPYEMLSSVTLGYLRLCLDELLTWLLVGGLLVALGVLLCGRWCLVFYGVVGGNEMIGVLKIAREHWRSSNLFSSILFICGYCLCISFGSKFS